MLALQSREMLLRLATMLGSVPVMFAAPVAPRAKNFFMIVSPCTCMRCYPLWQCCSSALCAS